MKNKLIRLSRRYQAALQKHLKQGRRASLVSARGLGAQALAAGLQTLALAKIHEQTLIAKILPGSPAGKRAALIKQAGIFFAAAILPIEITQRSAREAAARLKKIVEALSRRTVELAASNVELSQEIFLRKAVEESLKKANTITAGCWNNRINCRNSCGGCPARFCPRRRTSGKKSAANCMMSSHRL